MEYISAEEFLKQPKEVQRIFLDWWQPCVGDLYVDEGCDKKFDDTDGILVFEEFSDEYLCAYGRYSVSFKGDLIPLLTEGQLRKFIEDKTKYKLEISYYEINGYDISLTDGKTNYFNYLDLGRDLLQTYWKVACEIAKEG